LPANHPLREEADRMVETWSTDVLRLADDLFNQGQLNEAIAAARKIPAKASSSKLVENRIRQWQQIWARGEKIYQQAEAAMRKLNWKEAFNLAVRLLDLENEYWRTTKYEELTQRITTAREDGNKFYEAERLADAGGVDNLLKAIKLADSIRSTSYVYDAAQKLIPKYGRRLIALAETVLEQQNLQEALNIVNQIPEKANLEAEKQDFITLANAQASSWHSSVTDLESAIAQAQGIVKGRPFYSKAQRLMSRWQLEIQALTKLEKARVLAQGGSLNDLALAIAEASQVASSNPRWPEVQQQIQEWNTTIETTQDQPVLTQAEDLASQGNASSLQAAIAQANQIGRGRALYPQAQDRIQHWTDSLQRFQDQPLLDQAQQYANAGNLASAIATANRIASGRALYNSAQASIRTWRNQLQAEQLQAQAQQTLQEAYQLANTGAVLDMANAIQVASRVPISSSLRLEADTAIDRWSQQLLDAARNQAGSDLPGAIGLAQRIPSRARVYGEAQNQIETWKQSQTPVMAPQ
ncbi:MAG TPA: chromosome segregation ATPase, partial [Coleofasciculaceae cyanobacterium]